MIKSQDISVVVQGAVTSQYTIPCLLSLRQHLPKAELILSTSSLITEDLLQKLSYDKLIVSPDPGAVMIDRNAKIYNNINRQIVTSSAGIAAATRKYILKFRTDLLLTSNKWLDYFGVFDSKNPAQYFRSRVLVCNYYTRNPRILPVPYHLSDWILFGYAEDIKNYFKAPLQQREELIWFKNHSKCSKLFSHMLSRYVPEQYLCIQFIQKYEKISFENYYDNSRINIQSTERFLANNTVILDYKTQLGIVFQKYPPNRFHDKFMLIHHRDWKILYRKYSSKEITKVSWLRYLFKCYIFRTICFRVRRFFIRILESLKIKEQVKAFCGKC